MPFAAASGRREDAIMHAISMHGVFTGVGRFLEHSAAVVLGLIMMIVGLALGVTMIMMPAGLVIGLAGVAVLVGGLFARLDERD